MKKVVGLFSTLLFIVFIGICVILFIIARQPLVEGSEKVKPVALAEEGVAEVIHISFYYGQKQVAVVEVRSVEGHHEYLFYDDEQRLLDRRDTREAAKREDVIAQIERQFDVKEFRTFKPGFEAGNPLFEITFSDQAGHLHYYYVSYEEGEFMKRYSLKKRS